MEAVLLFFLTSLVSALGSLQLGPVNASVLRRALKGQFSEARWLAFGGSLPELLYAGVAVYGSQWLQKWESFGYWINLALVPLFLGMGLKLIFSKPAVLKDGNPQEKTRRPLWEGLGLGLLNPQLPLFWISILVWYKMNLGITVSGWTSAFSFILGTSFGAFGLLFGLVELCRKYKKRVLVFTTKHPPEIWIGIFFVVLAIVQAVKLF
jgi:threonine/homoserine/homoserine lactone efflux protein